MAKNMSKIKTGGGKKSISVNRQKSYFKKIAADMYRDRILYIMLIPFIAFYLIFVYKPMYGLQIAFRDYNIFKGISESPWVGLEHFRTFFGGPFFGRLLRNTIMISLYEIVFGFPAPIILALLFNEMRNKTIKKFSQTCTYIP